MLSGHQCYSSLTWPPTWFNLVTLACPALQAYATDLPRLRWPAAGSNFNEMPKYKKILFGERKNAINFFVGTNIHYHYACSSNKKMKKKVPIYSSNTALWHFVENHFAWCMQNCSMQLHAYTQILWKVLRTILCMFTATYCSSACIRQNNGLPE